jgi:membrane protease YdiL (CAAX protease family)
MMIERRTATPWLVEHLDGVLERVRKFSFEHALTRVTPSERRTDARAVPWGRVDTLLIIAWTIGLSAATIGGLFVFRLLVSFAFLFGQGLRLVPVGTYDRLVTAIAPYSSALTTLFVGGAVCSSLLYALFRHSVARYGVSLSSLGFHRLPVKTFACVALMFMPIILAGMVVTRLQTVLMGGTIHDPQLDVLTRGVPASPANFAMLSVLLIIFAPLTEETFFRGYLLTMLRQRMPSWAAICVSAAAFAGLHGVPVLFPWLFFMGIVFGVAVEKTGSLYSSMLLHAMVNAIATFGIVVAISGW